jgi:hypothetical protein
MRQLIRPQSFRGLPAALTMNGGQDLGRLASRWPAR